MGQESANAGERIRRVRLSRKMTLDGLSEATGIHSDSLSRLESGKRRLTVDDAVVIASALRVSPIAVCGWEAHRRRPLPTEPGVRFWGVAPGLGEQYAAQWWFVRQNGAGAVFYAPTRTDQLGIGVPAADVERVGLVRLPDPDGAA